MTHEEVMRLAIAQGELARGSTGDNPWVGCVLIRHDQVVASGHTHRPGEDHAERAALRVAQAMNERLDEITLYSTLEPCSFHGRTPACARVIAESGVRRVVIAMRDPHPKVDGAGVHILREAGVEVIEGVLHGEVRRQLEQWLAAQHPHVLRAVTSSSSLS